MFREFKVGELLDVTQGRRLKKSDFQDGDIPFVMASSKNNGVVAYLSNPVTTNTNFITADILGNVFYYDDLVGFGDDNCGLKLKEGHESEAVYLYLVGAFSRFKSIASYGNKLRGKWYEEQFIQLPVKPGADKVNYTEDDIDWAYMESYIHELDAYLKEIGLDDYTLTDDEREVLEREPVFKEFEVGELFDCNTTKAFYPTKENLPEGETPYISRTTSNNGVSGFYNDVDDKFTVHNKCITVGAETGIAFWQEKPFIPGVKVYTVTHKELNSENALFVTTLLNKSADDYGFSYLRSLNRLKAESIQLPVKPCTDEVNYTEADIDWDYMDAYVRVMEKQVIADVVDYKNEVIATTKDLVKK